MYGLSSIQLLAQEAAIELGLPPIEFQFSRPPIAAHGDYATGSLLSVAKKISQNPHELATKIVQQIQAKKPEYLEKVEVAGPGFINFFFSKKYFEHVFSQTRTNTETYGLPDQKAPKKVLVEHTQPNTNKPLHVGHLRNAVLGMALVHLQSAGVVTVESTNINNDRGIANIKGMWAYLFFGAKGDGQQLDMACVERDWKQLLHTWCIAPQNWLDPKDSVVPDHPGRGDYFVGHYYVVADKSGEDEQFGLQVKQSWAEMLQAWEAESTPDQQTFTELRKLWQQMNTWFYEGSRVTTNLLGVEFTLPEEYESALYQRGKALIQDAMDRGVPGFVRLEDGAIQVQLEQTHQLPNKILVRRDGTAIYMTFDIELTRKRVQEIGMDECVWVVGSDQNLHFQQLFAVCELLGIVPNRKGLTHFSYGMVRLPEGKLSSRKGRVVYADDILELAMQRAGEILRQNAEKIGLTEAEQKELSQHIGVGAVKWALLKVDAKAEITFDLERSVSLEGNSGPYVQYAHARACSILRKAEQTNLQKQDVVSTSREVLPLERVLADFPRVVEQSIQQLAPHTLCTYLFELAQAFNTFYAEVPVLESDDRDYLLLLTQTVAVTLRRGLSLLGIVAPERM